MTTLIMDQEELFTLYLDDIAEGRLAYLQRLSLEEAMELAYEAVQAEAQQEAA
jgi:hypothetical protein